MITPILLAAGASRRMGRPKALLEFGEKTCLEGGLLAVGGLGTPIVVLGPDRAEIEARIPLGGVRVAVNPVPESGQTASLKAGLALLPPEEEGFLVLPVDFPLVFRSDVERLVAAFEREGPSGRPMVVPSHRMKRGHPLVCRQALAAEFLALPETATAREVLGADPRRMVYVLFDEEYVLLDMDTPEDYRRCLRAFRRRSGSAG
ncbi:MAG TPA: nucleotidyltransferase family protein [Planctomycetota bacterium]|nr:nucleotidyltransferase family protein [Planctomycetota bacterium]